MNILLVEDDIILAESTACLIKRIGGHQVYITDEPTEVIQYCQSGKIDVVMMDVHLPGAEWQGEFVNGAELSRLLKTQRETAHIPIVLVTAYALADEQQKLLEISQADGLYAKPITDFKAFLEILVKLGNQR